MAGDQFIDPAVQANLNKLVAALAAKQTELTDLLAAAREAVGNLDNLSLEAVAADQERARALSASRPPGAGSIEEATALIEKQAQAERDVNAQIARQIELQAQAAAAARGATAAAQGAVGRAPTPAGLATDRIQAAVLAQEQAQLRSTQTELEQQIRAASATLQPKATLAKPGAYDTAALAAQVEAQLKAQEAAQKAAQTAVLTSAYAGPGLDPRASAAGDQAAAKAEQERAIAAANLRGRLTETANAETLLGAATQRNILQFTQGDNALQRHGALTVDFLNAAAKGQVTLREFGDQIGATIGKFAGWTGAAAAVYGAYNAVTDLSRGAIDASNTVGQLHRTIDGLSDQQAAQAIIGLAHETNTSMKEAGDAVFTFSRTFHDVGDATYAAGLALRAYQLDGVSVADQVKAQTAIHQQFGVTAKGLGPIYDELAAGQREFNARISDQIPLLQRSASAVKNAGGDLQTFIELTTIALRTTQLSGSQLGTAFLRSAATFLNPATKKGQTDRAVLASLGIDPNQNYTDLIVSSLERSATLSNSQRQQLSLAVFGPLLGGRTAGFFTGGASLLGDVQKQLAPSAVKGTFLSEFAKEIGTTQQQLKALGNNLQQLGAELGQSGLGAPIGGLVFAMNELLTISTKLLGIWSQLPAPIKDAAGAVAAAYGVRAVTQRAGVTGVPFFGRSAEQQAQAQALSGLKGIQDFYQQQYTSTVRNAATAGITAEAANRRYQGALAGGDQEQIDASEAAYKQALARRLQLDLEAEALAQQALGAQATLNAVQQRINDGMTAQAALAAEGVPHTLNTLERGKPIENPVVPVADSVALTGQAANKVAADATAAGEEARGALGRASTAATGALEKVSSGLTSLGSSIIGFVNPWIAGGLIAAIGLPELIKAFNDGQKAIDALQAASNAEPGGGTYTPASDLTALRIEQYTGILQQKASGFGAIFAKTNELFDKGLLAVQHATAAAAAQAAQAGVGVPGPASVDIYQNNPLQQQIDKLNKLADNAPIYLADSGPGRISGSVQADRGYQPQLNAAGQAYQAQLAELQQLFKKQASEFYSGAPTVDLSAGQIQAQVQAAFDNFKSGFGSLADVQHEFSKDLKELTLSNFVSPADAATTEAIIADLKSRLTNSVQALRQDLNALTSVQLDRQIIDYSNMLKLFGAQSEQGQRSLTHLSSVLGVLASRAAFDPNSLAFGSKTETNLDKFAQAQGQITAAINGQVSEDLRFALEAARTKKQRAAAYQQAAANVRRYEVGLTAEIGAQQKYVTDLERQVVIEKAEQAALNQTGKSMQNAIVAVTNAVAAVDNFISGILGGIGKLAATTQTGAQQLQQTLAKLKQHTGALNFLKGVQDQLNKVTGDTIQGFQGLSDKALNTKTPTVPASEDPFELTRLRRELQQARDQGDPVKAAQDAVGLAHDEVAAARNEHERLQGLIDLANAENQLNKAIEDRTQSYYTYLESTTTDPIKQAQIALKAASEAVQNATRNSGKGTKDYYDAKAKQNDARQKLVDAQVSGKEQDIQFYLDMGQISVQTAIQEYNALLTMHNLTKQQRQRILEDIKKLKDGSASEFGALDLGTIRLPTPYEIRRALLASQQYGNQALTQQTGSNTPAGAPPAATLTHAPAPQIHVHVYNASDVPAVGAQLSRYFSGTGKSLQRAAGIRGGG